MAKVDDSRFGFNQILLFLLDLLRENGQLVAQVIEILAILISLAFNQIWLAITQYGRESKLAVIKLYAICPVLLFKILIDNDA
ncbi:Uncharacterised protein [Vibrio cholerae]|nr:Uncharacterised protein [Vibrio cholerae]